jgi:MerR family transcriptional regulator/heat shock protein HspR
MNTKLPILTISVAAKLLDLHPRTIMLYERSGFLSPHRTNTNRRMFSVSDLDDLQFVKFLTRTRGINLLGVKTLLEAIAIADKEGVRLKELLFPTFKPKELI